MRSPLELTFGALLGALGPLLGGSWPSLGRPWSLLGPSWGALDRSWGELDVAKNSKKTKKMHFWCFLAALGPVLAPLGLIFTPPGQYFNVSLVSPEARLAMLCIGCSSAVPFKASWNTFLAYGLDLLEIGNRVLGTIRLDPPRVRRSPRSVLQL